MKKRIALAACLLLALTGCGRGIDTPTDEGISLPAPTDRGVVLMTGEIRAASPAEVTMYYKSADGTSLVEAVRTLTPTGDDTLAALAVRELLSPTGGTLISAAPTGTTLLSLEFANRTVVVRLSVESMSAQSESETVQLFASVANTLLGLDGIDGVSLLTGFSAPGIAGLPLGCATSPIASLGAAMAEYDAEATRIRTGTPDAVSRTALIYLPQDDCFVPEMRHISFSADGSAALAQELSYGDRAVFRDPAAVLSQEVYLSGGGQRVLKLGLSSALLAPGVTPEEAAAAAALTYATFLPGIDAIRIEIDGAPLDIIDVFGKPIRAEEGLFARSAFSGRIGSTVTLHFAAENGRLRAIPRAMTRGAALSPRLVLEQMLAGPTEAEIASGIRSPFPDGAMPEDILGVRVEGSVAEINLSAAFYALCQSLSETEERALIYAMVNTLTGLPGISAVRFLIEGGVAPDLAGNISLISPLIANPGLTD